jgi:hypothetical protein
MLPYVVLLFQANLENTTCFLSFTKIVMRLPLKRLRPFLSGILIQQRRFYMKYDTDKFLYKLGWIVFGVSILVVIVTRLWTIHNPFFLFPCIFYSLTNLYCPGCGGTRSVLSLLHGHPVASFR